MCDMKQSTLPLPNPNEWVTVSGAAHFMGVHRRTVERLIERGTLTGYRMWGAPGEQVPVMVWRDELITVRNARQRAAAGGAR
jgi:excisionase family DNA binding protein